MKSRVAVSVLYGTLLLGLVTCFKPDTCNTRHSPLFSFPSPNTLDDIAADGEALQKRSTVEKPSILIDKSDDRLYWTLSDDPFSFSVSFGKVKGRKEYRDDRKTPEGEYFICGIHPSDKNYRFFSLNYPNVDDAQRGLDEGKITQEVYDQILSAQQQGVCPPKNTSLGSDIGIHGKSKVRFRGRKYDIERFFDSNWVPLLDITDGCIMAKNNDIDRLYAVAPVGTKVVIRE